MTHSKKRFFSSILSASIILVLLLYLIASSVVIAGSLSVLGIGGFFLTADELVGNQAVAYPEMGDIDAGQGAEAVTDTTACEERPMIALQLDDAFAEGIELYKDVEVPFFEDWWMTISIIEPDGALDGDDLTLYTTQLELGTMSIENIELLEGGDPGRGGDYTPPDDRSPADRSTDIFGPDSGEFLLIGDPEQDVAGPETTATDVKGWLHAATGQNLEFIADINDPGAIISLNVDYHTTSDLENRYDQIGIETRNPDAYEREGYFDCLPGNG